MTAPGARLACPPADARPKERIVVRRNKRRVRFYTLTCGSDDLARSHVSIAFPETTLLRSAEAALEFEGCGRDAKRYSARFPKDPEAGRALFGYVRSESRLLSHLLDNAGYKGLLRLVQRHSRAPGRHERRLSLAPS